MADTLPPEDSPLAFKGNGTEIEISIRYEGFIAACELTVLLDRIDNALWYEFAALYNQEYDQDALTVFGERLRFIAIKDVQQGSIILTIYSFGVAIVTYCTTHFYSGINKVQLGSEISKCGFLLAQIAKTRLERFNLVLEKYLKEAKERNSNIKSIIARKKAPLIDITVVPIHVPEPRIAIQRRTQKRNQRRAEKEIHEAKVNEPLPPQT